jgi:hypothetical protein
MDLATAAAFGIYRCQRGLGKRRKVPYELRRDATNVS